MEQTKTTSFTLKELVAIYIIGVLLGGLWGYHFALEFVRWGWVKA